MAELIEWNNNLSLGIDDVDEQHIKLVELINDLHTAMLERKTKEVLGPILNELVEYTIFHFSYEENIFKDVDYPEQESHIAEHENFVKKAAEFKDGFQRGSFMVSIEMMKFLVDWLIAHIMGSDKKFSQFYLTKTAKS